MLFSSFSTRSMVFAYFAKAQLPFSLFRDLFNDTAEFTLCYGLHDCSHLFQGYFIHSLSTLYYYNAPSLTTRLTGDYRDRTLHIFGRLGSKVWILLDIVGNRSTKDVHDLFVSILTEDLPKPCGRAADLCVSLCDRGIGLPGCRFPCHMQCSPCHHRCKSGGRCGSLPLPVPLQGCLPCPSPVPVP